MGSTGYGSNLGDAGTTGSSDLAGGTRRDDASLEAGTTRSAALGDQGAAAGTGQVHSGLSVGSDVDTGYSAIAAAGSSGGSQQGGTMDRVKDAASQARDRVQSMAGDLPGRVNEAAGQAREKAGQAMHRAERVLEERGILDRVRENPLPALGIAFGLGFLLAGSDDDSGKHGGSGRRGSSGGALNNAKHQLKGAIMGGLSAAIAQEGRNLLGMAQGKGNQGGMLGSLLENLQGGGSGGSGRSGSGGSGSSGGAPHTRPSHQEMR